jgi:hypothetical protein
VYPRAELITDSMNDSFRGATGHQNFQSQWLLMAKFFTQF